MYCTNCGNKNDDEAKFCSSCGAPFKSSYKGTIKLTCKKCGGSMEIDEDREILKCPFCGSKNLIIESEKVKIERIKRKSNERVQADRNKRDIEINKMNAANKELSLIIVFSVVAILFALACLMLVK